VIFPDQNYLSNFETKLPKIQQKGKYWCIPASIENMLRFVGINGITQEDLVILYCNKFHNEALKDPSTLSPICLSSINKKEIIKIAHLSVFTNGNFNTFKILLEEEYPEYFKEWNLKFKNKIYGKNDYYSWIKKYIYSQDPVLISFQNLNGDFHICMVLGYSYQTIKFYDPALNQIISMNIENLKFSDDLLALVKL